MTELSSSTIAAGSPRLLEGKVAVVTGAGNGIGRAHALVLAEQGAKVVVNDNGSGLGGDGNAAAPAEAVVSEIRAADGIAVANIDSVADTRGAGAIIEQAISEFGTIDILINNAGNSRLAGVENATDEDFDMLANVHLRGTFATVRAAAPHFRRQRGGVIVNTSSTAGLGHFGAALYSAVKEGIVGFTRSVARDLGPYGVRCNAIRPGAISRMLTDPKLLEMATIAEEEYGFPTVADIFLLDRLRAETNIDEATQEASCRAVANLAVWLCTPAAAPLNGMTLRVNGGQIGIMSDPAVTRALFRPEGWDLSSLTDPAVTSYLLAGIKNRFTGR